MIYMAYIVPMSALAVVSVFLALWYLFVPFEPVRSYDYDIKPEEVCAGGPVTVEVQRARLPGYGELGDLSLEESWTTVDVKGFKPGTVPFTNESVVQDVGPVERSTVQSPTLRRAPPIPGRWTATITTEIAGTQLGFLPREQTNTYVSEDVITVLPENHPECTEEERGSAWSS